MKWAHSRDSNAARSRSPNMQSRQLLKYAVDYHRQAPRSHDILGGLQKGSDRYSTAWPSQILALLLAFVQVTGPSARLGVRHQLREVIHQHQARTCRLAWIPTLRLDRDTSIGKGLTLHVALAGMADKLASRNLALFLPS